MSKKSQSLNNSDKDITTIFLIAFMSSIEVDNIEFNNIFFIIIMFEYKKYLLKSELIKY